MTDCYCMHGINTFDTQGVPQCFHCGFSPCDGCESNLSYIDDEEAGVWIFDCAVDGCEKVFPKGKEGQN